MADWNPRANEIVVRAVEIESWSERMTFTKEMCGSDLELFSVVSVLLQAHFEAGSFLSEMC